MTREDIIRMAREAGWPGMYAKPLFSITMQEDDFLRFAALVAESERQWFAQIINRIEMPALTRELILDVLKTRGGK